MATDLITGNGWNLPIGGYVGGMEGWNQAEERRDARRLANRKNLMELADMAAKQGKQIGVEEWAEIANGMLTPGDMLTSSAPSEKVLELIRDSKATEAEKVATERKRQEFRAELEDMNLIEAEVQKQALGGKSEAEIAGFLKDNYGEKADRVLSRVPNLVNRATLEERQKAATTYGANFEDEKEAEDFIASNPGLTRVAQDGIREQARKNRIKREDAIHATAMDIAAKIGNGVGVVSEQQVNALVDTFVPPSAKPEVRAAIREKAFGMAKASQEAALAGKQAVGAQEVQIRLAQQAPEMAAQLTRLQSEEQTRQQAAQASLGQTMLAPVTSQLSFLKQATEEATKAKDKPRIAALQSASAFAQTYVVDNLEELVQAFQEGDTAKIERIKQAARPVSQVVSTANALSSFIKGPPIRSRDQLDSELASIMPPPSVQEDLGKRFNRLNSIATSQAGKPEGAASSELAAVMRRRFIADTANMVLDGARMAMQESGRMNMSPEEVDAVMRSYAERYARAFNKGNGLSGEVLDAVTAPMAAEIMAATRRTGGVTYRPPASEQLQRNWDEISRQNLVTPRTNVLPGAPMPSPRAPQPQAPVQGAPSNQWWNR